MSATKETAACSKCDCRWKSDEDDPAPSAAVASYCTQKTKASRRWRQQEAPQTALLRLRRLQLAHGYLKPQ
jgi:hypothetical protein